jgi:hypothetical protein
MASNPFHDLYLTEAIGSSRFVELFSPEFVKHSLPLFEPGNVVLRGLQGSGKTMLLNLLKPEIRLAYHNSDYEFPVPDSHSKFIAAGINLRKSGIMDFGQLIDENSTSRQVQEFSLQFADFVNYWIVSDLLQSISRFYAHPDDELLKCIGLAPRGKLDSFVAAVAADACWFGYLNGISDLASMLQKINQRILSYRSFVNLNLATLPDDIATSKTVIGNPILKVVDALREHRLIASDTNVFVRIDQYEQLPTLNVAGHKFGAACQELIHKAIGARDPRVSYRIGTRHYAWPDSPQIYGTRDTLENKRDYIRIDIDERLTRKENRATWIFPELAQDIFLRRIRGTEFSGRMSRTAPLKSFFGDGLTPEQRALSYATNLDSRKTSLQLEPDWPEGWRNYFEGIAVESPLAGRLAVAWVRQKVKGAPQDPGPALPIDNRPWTAKPYWVKDRTEQALTQIASASRQQPIWCGEKDVIGLSGGNILVFLSICQHIWDAWLRGNRDRSVQALETPIEANRQSQGIVEASEEWLKKQTEGFDAMRRRTFVRTLGQHFYSELTGDRQMSYPGHTGFSLNAEELDKSAETATFLRRCVDYGDLYEAPHTSKTKGEKRIKYYLAPVLTPHFKIPHKHIKEPEYVHVADVRSWITPTDHSPAVAAAGSYHLGSDRQGTLWDAPPAHD